MYVSIDTRRHNKGFAFPEVLIALTISLFIVLSMWSVYVMGITWWAQLMPRIDAQRVVRVAVKTIVYGLADSTVGTDTISDVPYSRRNGIAWAKAMPTLDESDSNIVKIKYDLESLTNQSFYMLIIKDPNKTESPEKLYHNNAQSPVSGTTGLTGLSFELTPPNMVKVTATVDRNVNVGGQAPYQVKAELSQIVCLRNI
jgi:Tfp pilus assembly protein PilV